MWSVERRIAVSSIFVLLVTLSIGALAWRFTVQVQEAVVWLDQAHRVVTGLETVLSCHHETESALRGYLVTGRREFLTQHDDARQRMRNALAALRERLADMPQQADRLRRVQALLDTRAADHQAVVNAFQQGGGAGMPLLGDSTFRGEGGRSPCSRRCAPPRRTCWPGARSRRGSGAACSSSPPRPFWRSCSGSPCSPS